MRRQEARWTPLTLSLLAGCLQGVITANGTTGKTVTDCDGGSCGGICCAPDAECVASRSTGLPTCESICEKAIDCGGSSNCCSPRYRDGGLGSYAGHGDCEAYVTSSPIPCLCADTADCDAVAGKGEECVPYVNADGLMVGPYTCAADDGKANDGCASPGGSTQGCVVPPQFCTADGIGNQFCSVSCRSDADCGNEGVACCNCSCLPGRCCGLCSSGDGG